MSTRKIQPLFITHITMTLPQKIRLLADFAGYPAGEYAYYDEKGFPSYLQSYIA